ncbi:ABC transporter ATP-binding protein [Nocardioides sp. HDW12B]|uniref:ABC transporter ATP-binding protein n=1 Tax=Nocardioides sp. HDW12B TaxID=2714939 RepID=UPI0019809699|nr:ABC transporter ATP-binding protein [Nocardioides sp. HDW12B]
MSIRRSAAAIELRGLRRTFATRDGEVTAVDGVDLTVRPGEVVALLGPNGAGKTTTLDVVLGLTQPTSGSVTVLGGGAREAVRAGRVSAVLQTGGLLGDLTVRETVRFIASTFTATGRDTASVDEVLERAGVTRLADRLVAKCSGGEQQRLRFALALLPDPDLLVLDEPTAGMDVNARREFWSVMHAEAARGRTVVFATHYLEEADSFAQRIVVMTDGRVIADGSVEEVRARATGRTVTCDLLDVIALERLRAHPAVAAVAVDGDRVSVRSSDSDAVARLLLTELGGHQVEITSGSLEDAFVHLTHGDRPVRRTTEEAS